MPNARHASPMPAHGGGEVAHHLGLLRGAEVETVRDRERTSTERTRRCARLRRRRARRRCTGRATRCVRGRRSTSAIPGCPGSPRRDSGSRSTAASAPGTTSVFRRTMWSYCRHTHCLADAIDGDASRRSSSLVRRRPRQLERIERVQGAPIGLRRPVVRRADRRRAHAAGTSPTSSSCVPSGRAVRRRV